MTQPMNPEKLAELAARIDIHLEIQTCWMLMGCPPVAEMRTAHNALVVANTLRRRMGGRREILVPAAEETVLTEASLRSLSGKRSSTDGEGAR